MIFGLFNKSKPSREKAEAIRLFRDHVSSGKAEFFKKYDMDFVMGDRKGSWLSDMDGGKKLFNLHCNGGVFNLGHRNEEIIQALQSALEKLDIGNHHLMSRHRARLAKMISALMPGNLNYTVFGVSGGEAMDLAIKVARGFTKRKKIISAIGGYHGHTGLAVLTGDEQYKAPFRLESDNFTQIPFNDLEALEHELDDETAAVIFETIPATLGMPVPAMDFYRNVKALCEKRGALLILDEVQSGLGRTGKLWAFEHFEVTPDIVVLGKGLSGGIYPITATVLDQRLESVFHQNPFSHISTFGGSEPGCAVALKVLDISSKPGFLEHVNVISEEVRFGLEKLQQKHNKIFKRIHGLGLMLALELHDEAAGPILTKTAYDNSLLMVYAHNDPKRVQFLPPLTMTLGEIPFVMEKLNKSIKQMKTLLTFLKAKKAISSWVEKS